MSDLHVYDTTLRDGAQQEGLNLSVGDKLAIAAHLDDLGVGFIEGGWPGANPKDTEFFARAAQDLRLRNATLAAFGATRRAGGRAESDPLVRALLDSQAQVITLVAKSHTGHVERALRTDHGFGPTASRPTARAPHNGCSSCSANAGSTSSWRMSPPTSPGPAGTSRSRRSTAAARSPTPSSRSSPRATSRAGAARTASHGRANARAPASSRT